MPEYKLIYFNLMGRAELTRWLFAYGGIPYTDERIEREEWPEKKKSEFCEILLKKKSIRFWREGMLGTESLFLLCFICLYVYLFIYLCLVMISRSF